LAREKCAANTLLSTAAPPFTTTAKAVHYKPLRRPNSTLEQFVAFKWSFPKNLEFLSPEGLTISTLCVHQIVPRRIDPFEPTEAELAGDVPPSEHGPGTERQACTRLAASRDTTPYGTHSIPNLHLESLADTFAQPTSPQEEPTGAEPPGAQGKKPMVLDLSKHSMRTFALPETTRFTFPHHPSPSHGSLGHASRGMSTRRPDSVSRVGSPATCRISSSSSLAVSSSSSPSVSGSSAGSPPPAAVERKSHHSHSALGSHSPHGLPQLLAWRRSHQPLQAAAGSRV